MPKDLRVLQQPSVTQTQGQLREDPGWSLKSNQLIPGWQSIAKGTLLAQWELLAYRLPVGREPCKECAHWLKPTKPKLLKYNSPTLKKLEVPICCFLDTTSPLPPSEKSHSSFLWGNGLNWVKWFLYWKYLLLLVTSLAVTQGKGLADPFLVHTRILGMWSWRREISSAVELSFLKQFPHLPGAARFSALPLSSSLVILVVSLPWCFCCGCCLSLLFPVIAHVCTHAHTQTFLLCFANLHQKKKSLL